MLSLRWAAAMWMVFIGLAAASMAAVTMTARAETEEPAFTIVEKVGAVEIRKYADRPAADVIVGGNEETARNEGFRLLADFIFGNNTARTSIATTAPVSQ